MTILSAFHYIFATFSIKSVWSAGAKHSRHLSSVTHSARKMAFSQPDCFHTSHTNRLVLIRSNICR